jgi:hypothetical protein
MSLEFLDLGNLLLAVAVLFTTLILVFELLERRRENRRQRTMLEAIEAEYQLYCRMGRL